MSDSYTALTKRLFLFACWIFLSFLVFKNQVIALVRFSLSHDDGSYLTVIPFLSALVIYLEREKIFSHVSSDKVLGWAFLALSGCAALASLFAPESSPVGLRLSARILSLALLWVAGFAFLFGKTALRTGRFALIFLSFMIPLPGFLLDRIIYLLQEGSAWITGAFFDVVGVPALREGLVFHLSRVSIEVSKECSGIRSSMALLILALLISHFRLRHFPNKLLFIACGLVMMFIKNGIRIATLTLLAMYVDLGFLFGRLHHQGGIVFFVVALLLLLPLLFFLERRESKRPLTAVAS